MPRLTENGKKLKEEIRIKLDVFGDDVRQEIRLFGQQKVDWGWFFPNGKCILIEDKEKTDSSLEYGIDQMFYGKIYRKTPYVKLCQEHGYNDIIAIVVKQNENDTINIYAKHNGDRIDCSDLHDLQYYKNILGVEPQPINPQDIYFLTNKINNLLHHEFSMTNLIDRMIFTGCLLLEAFHGNLNLQNITTMSHLKTQVCDTLSEIDGSQTPRGDKLSKLSRKFKSVVFNEPYTHEVKSLVSYILRIKKIILHSANIFTVDIMNIFFNEFGRKKTGTEHGQVFTPDHIGQLMAKLVDLNKNDKILDPTCGSGALLVKAMFDATKGLSITKQKEFFNNNVFGTEYDENVAYLCFINMLLHQDGLTNIVAGKQYADALKESVGAYYKTKQITKVVSNPPYERKYKPIDIMINVMDNMVSGGLAAFLLPVGKLRTNEKKVRKHILSKHTLKAIIKLPEVFEGVAGAGEVAIFLFETGTRQDYSKPAFGYWIKDDGYITGSQYKNQGRVDDKHIWNDVLAETLRVWKNKDLSVKYAKLINLKDDLEYLWYDPIEILPFNFKKTYVQRYLFENPEIGKYFKTSDEEEE